MNILVVGNVLKDVYLNLSDKDNQFETDENNVKWLDISFDASSNYFFSRNSSLGGAAVSLEVFEKLGINASVSSSNIKLSDGELEYSDHSAETYRYILISDGKASYFVPSKTKLTNFTPPAKAVDYLYIDRSARLDSRNVQKILTYLELSKETKLIVYVKNSDLYNIKPLINRADLCILEEIPNGSVKNYAPNLVKIPKEKIIKVSESQFSYLNIIEHIAPNRIDLATRLSFYSIATATIIGCFILGRSVEESLKMARANVENSKLDATLSLSKLEELANKPQKNSNLEFIAANLLINKKGILAADESGGSIKKKFNQLNIPDTYNNRRDYRNIFFTTKNLANYINGAILFDETTKQFADNGQDFVSFLISRHIIPGIKVDQGLEKFDNSLETYTKGLDGLDERLKNYYANGLRFTKWRAAFEIKLSISGEILTPTDAAIEKNCDILAEYASKAQAAGLVPIVEPEVVYDGYYGIDTAAQVTGKILDCLFEKLKSQNVNLKACILKVNMILAGKQFKKPSTTKEVGHKTAELLKNHVPESLAGVVFLSGGQTVEQATKNLAAIVKNGPFPWPVTFSFARALQDPALYAWAGDNNNIEDARSAFLSRLVANVKALE